MYITPNTNIKIYRNVPLDNKYTDTINFNSISQQNAYFHNGIIPKYSLQAQSYQRVNKQRIRVEILSDNLYDCNYLAFQNSAYENKWFYAFIKSVEWINNVTSEIEFEIDVMQTYMFDIELKPCFVEREHVNDDTIGINRIYENLETGDFVTTYDVQNMNNSVLIPIMVTSGILPDGTNSTTVGSYCNNTFNGLDFYAINPRRVENSPTRNYWLQQYIGLIQQAGRTDGIIAIFMYPINLLRQNPNNEGEIPISFPSDSSPQFAFVKISNATSIFAQYSKQVIYESGFTEYINSVPVKYVPKNNKLYTSQFLKCIVENGNGGVSELDIEKFNSQNLEFNIYGSVTITGDTRLIPFNYDDVVTQKPNNEVGLDGGGFATSAWTSNVYYSWLNANGQQWKANMLIDTTKSVAGVATSLASSDAISAGLYAGDIAEKTFNNVTKISDLKHIPDSVSGKQSNIMNAITGYSGFNLKIKTVNPITAKIIDDYFSLYGYKVNTVKVPSRSNRQHWTYVKTVGCKVIGGCPTDDIIKIESIYDNGVRFWNDPYNVGNYLDNNGIMRENRP